MKFCVIGLGRFGYQVATTLAENGMEVLAIDSNESIVASIRDHVTQAICMRVNDEASLRSIGIEEMDTAVVAMGENFAQSILITALLKKRITNIKVVARAINEIHKEILLLTGADEVILPEKELGIRIADTLSSPFADFIRITKEFSISRTPAPAKFVGKRIEELTLYDTYKIHCIGREHDQQISSIEPSYLIQEDDVLVFSGRNQDLEKIATL